jgi:carotenoid cleavage dioxygenase
LLVRHNFEQVPQLSDQAGSCGLDAASADAEWYRNRWVRGPHAAQALGERLPVGHFGVSPIGANTNVIGHAGKTLALVESGLANYELNDELHTVGVCDFRPDADRRVHRAP